MCQAIRAYKMEKQIRKEDGNKKGEGSVMKTFQKGSIENIKCHGKVN